MGGIVIRDLEGVGPLHYKVDNAHFHVNSEHTFNGRLFDLELHFVHMIDHKDYKEFANCSPTKGHHHHHRKHEKDNY